MMALSSDMKCSDSEFRVGKDKLCLFCYKSIPPGGYINEGGNRIVKRLVKLLEGFIGEKIKTNGCDKWLNCCGDCEIILESFCEVYHQWKCLELRAQWRLERMVNVMKFANRVPSRLKLLKLVFDEAEVGNEDGFGGDKLKRFKDFRNGIIKKCAARLNKSQPRVTLKRWNCSAVEVDKMTEATESLSTLNNAIGKPENKYSHFAPIFANFLGWIISLSTVVQLATITSRNEDFLTFPKVVEEQGPTETENIDDDLGIEGNNCSSEGSQDVIIRDLVPLRNDDEVNSASDGEIVCGDQTLVAKMELESSFQDCKSSLIHSDNDQDFPFDDNEFPEECSRFEDDGTVFNEPEQTAKLEEVGAIPEIKPGTSPAKHESVQISESSPRKSYNLRGNRKRTYNQIVEVDEDKGNESDHSTNSHLLDDESEESSLSSDMDTDTEEIQKTGKFNTVKKRRGNRNAGTAKHFTCKLDGCSGSWIIENFNDHQRLHAPGHFKCNFCDKIEENVARLCKHEIESHPATERNSKDKNNYCPRCTYNSGRYSAYQWHFAETHVPGFEKRKDTFWNTNKITCEICNKKILRLYKTIHFKQCHDTTDMNPDEIWKCHVDNCSAYFKSKPQKNTHVREQHGNDVETVKPFLCPVVNCNESCATERNLEIHRKLHGSFKCDFCEVVMTYAPSLAIHETTHATSTNKNKLSSTRKRKDYKCARCPNCFQKKRLYIQHHLKFHLKLTPPSRKQFCPICQGALLGGPHPQKVHFQEYHDTQGLNQDLISKCDLCPAYFVKSNQLIEHKFKIHYQSKCPECGKCCRDANTFKRHVYSRHSLVNLFPLLNDAEGENGDKMDDSSNSDLDNTNIIEPKVEEAKEELKKHKLLHEPGQFKCNFCDKVEENVASLSKHEIQAHSSLKNKRKRKNRGKKSVFFCPRCPCQYLHFHTYQQHFAQSHIKGFENLRKNTIPCNICHRRIPWPSRKQHFKLNHDTTGMDPELIRKCNVDNCSAYFKTKLQRYFHVRNDHGIFPKSVESDEELVAAPVDGDGDNKNTIYVCTIPNCQERFDTVKSLESHKRLHGSFKCNFCEVVKEYAPELAIHEMEHAKREPGETYTWKRQQVSKAESFSCPHCPRDFPSESRYVRHHLIKHLKVSPAAKIQVCPICQAESKGGEGFQMQHFKTCHDTDGMTEDQIQRCDLCPAYYVKSDQLLDHKFKLHFQKKCPECGKCYKRANELRRHMEERHPLVNLFPHLKIPCDRGNCQRKFATEAERDHHKTNERHFDDNNLKCSKCDKIFKDGYKLERHVKIVHPQTYHICNECGKSFKSMNKLNTHLEFHKGPDAWEFQCSTCGKKCVNKYKLAEHVRTHTKEKPFICQVCGEKYAHRHNWLNHVKTKHPEEFNEMDHNSGKRRKVGGNFLSRKGSKKGECITAGVQQQ